MQKVLEKIEKYLKDSSTCYIEVDEYSKEDLEKLISFLKNKGYKHIALEYENVIKTERKV